jgi:glutamate/tyrosine decarboxylase-like PLP-dependent enzyme
VLAERARIEQRRRPGHRQRGAGHQRRLDVKAICCDAYVTSPHKWLLAPKGTGVRYIRRDVQPPDIDRVLEVVAALKA